MILLTKYDAFRSRSSKMGNGYWVRREMNLQKCRCGKVLPNHSKKCKTKVDESFSSKNFSHVKKFMHSVLLINITYNFTKINKN